MNWWLVGAIALGAFLGNLGIWGYLADIAKETRNVGDEVNRLRVTMIELDKNPLDRDPLP